MEARRDIFQAIADPTRRSILGLLALQAMTPGAIAENFTSSRQTISRHIQILTECELVKQKQKGREIYYTFNPRKMKEAAEWINQYKRFWEANFDSLEMYLEKEKTPTSKEKIMAKHENKREALKIVRAFNAPKTMVFDAFATADAFAQWWGPAGMPVTVVAFDFRPGGKVHYRMEGHGKVMWGLFNYKKVERPDLLEFVSSFSDENGNICPSPFPIEFPLEVLNILSFEEKDGVTTVTLTGNPLNANAEQEDTYYSLFDSMRMGFAGTLNQLEDYLGRINA